MELYKKYRPQSLDQIIGQLKIVQTISTMVKNNQVPHAMLFSGPSGTGKTSTARILRKELNCKDDPYNYVEINAAESRGIDTVREIQDRMRLSPIWNSKMF